MKQLHEIQLKILQKLLFSNGLRYMEMKPDRELENNQFDWHVDRMIESGWVEKRNSVYKLTNAGKEYANRIDTEQNKFSVQAKVTVSICTTRNQGGEKEYLIYTRLKQPFYGCQGFMSGKAKFGESILEAAKRELKEETNLEGDPKVVRLRHYRVYSARDDSLLEDKFMFFCKVENPTGELIANNEGKFEWVEEDRVFDYVTNHFESLDSFKYDINMMNNFTGVMEFEELRHVSEKF